MKETMISKLQSEIRTLDNEHYGTVEDIRDGREVNGKELHLSIMKADKLREKLVRLGGTIPRNPNLG